MKSKIFKILQLLGVFLGISLSIYLLVYLISFALSDPVKQKNAIKKSLKQDILFQPDLDHIISVLWKDSSTLYLVKQDINPDPSITEHKTLTLLEYNVQTREIISDTDISKAENAILGMYEGKTVLCSWSILPRESKDQIATKIDILDIATKQSLKHMDLYNTVKIDRCDEGRIKVSEGVPELAMFNDTYDIQTQAKVEKSPPSFEIKGSSDTEVYYDGQKLFTLDLPNKYTSVSTLSNSSAYALIDVDGKILVYIKQ